MTGRNQSARSGSQTARSPGIAPSLREGPRRRSLLFVSSLRGWGGGEKWMLSAAAAMQARGHRVTLAVQPGSELASRGQSAGLAVRTVRLGGWLDPRALLGLAGVLVRSAAEVVCANLDKEVRQVLLAAGLVGRGRLTGPVCAGRPLTGRALRLVVRRGSPVPIKDTWHYRLVYERGVDRLICNAEALVESACGPAPWFPRDRVHVIPNGVDLADLAARATPALAHAVREELGIAPGAVVVACVGEVGWRKGQEHVLAAAAALRDRFPDAVWLIVGEGDGRGELETRAAAQGLQGVRFLGFRRDVPAILAASQVLVLPSRSEGFPNTLLEGMALGLPVAASRADGIPELVEDGVTGLLHAVDDVQAFVDGVGRLLADPELRHELGEAGAGRARERFAAAAVMDRVEDVLAGW